ncbi:acyl carrier protein [Streptomyces chattanoogensis]|uniref:Phosphopantetheine-binding protein n=1 Tax=Streptomyces chattanoogensis TaxID=66876 RepID=A0A0N0GZH7_9ACTN|nr:acyl carrier protein [Streptomyces chattanoogensis]KPC62752.1 phosphopantetheine-binding protein [Streptomyces chattanoogensis]
MSDTIGEFVLSTLGELNYDTSGVTDTTPLGDGGLELESLSLAEIAMHVEQQYGVQFDDEELESIGKLTFGEFVKVIGERSTGPAVTEQTA